MDNMILNHHSHLVWIKMKVIFPYLPRNRGSESWVADNSGTSWTLTEAHRLKTKLKVWVCS